MIGDEVSVSGFKAVGFDTFCETSPIKASKLLRSLAEQGYAVIFIIEDLYKNMDTAVSRYSFDGVPAVISLPGLSGTDGSGLRAVNRAIKRAVGSDIVK